MGKTDIMWHISVIKIVVTPQLDYIAMVLPIAIRPQFFRQYDKIIKLMGREKTKDWIK